MLLYCCVNLKISLKKWTSVLKKKKETCGSFLKLFLYFVQTIGILATATVRNYLYLKIVFILSEVMREVGIHESWENMY